MEPPQPLTPAARGFLSRLSIEQKLLLLTSGLLLLLAAALSGAVYLEAKRSVLRVASERLESVTRQFSDLFRQSGTQMTNQVRATARKEALRAYLRSPVPHRRSQALAALRYQGPQADQILAVQLRDAAGRVLLATGAGAERVATSAGADRIPRLAGSDSVAIGEFRPIGDSVLYPTLARVEAGDATGFVVQWRRLATSPRAREQLAQLIGSDAALLFGNVDGAVWTDLVSVVPSPPVEVASLRGTVTYERAGVPGQRLAAAAPVPGTPWLVLVEFPRRNVLAPVGVLVRRMAAIALGCVILGLAAAWGLSRRITTPLGELTDAADAIAAGDYTHRVRVERSDELGRLAAAFGVMATKVEDSQRRLEDEVNERTRELQASEERARAVVDTAYDAFVAIDERGVVTGWNGQAERIFGWSRDEAVGQMLADTIIPPQHRDAHRAGLTRYLATGEGPVLNRIIEITALRKNGEEFPVELTISPLVVGGKRSFTSFVRDITERKRTEAAIRELNRELERKVEALAEANRELEAFSYSVSHDLRAPLRHMAGFAELLEKRASMALDDKGRRHLETIRSSAVRMGRLIDDLLAFSRIGRTELQATRVELDALISGVLKDVQRDGDGRRVDWVVQPLPAVHGDPALLRQVLVNLLSNALKYTGTRENARIEVGVKGDGESGDREQREVVVYVRDNGVGFDPRHADKLFGVFQRLHSGEQFEGTGIGLANVRRIVMRHGGRVWAEAAVDQGATFYVALPSREEGSGTGR
ncbi:MAG: PAS domain S-box protein [Gemmatimonadetes bacterium]|nr:PAS domain S-box protein [Gemmatimonadota bacterium]